MRGSQQIVVVTFIKLSIALSELRGASGGNLIFSLRSRAEFLHHVGEFFEGNLPISIGINLLNNVVDCLLAHGLSEAQDLLDLAG